jgi:hypothetical protein
MPQRQSTEPGRSAHKMRKWLAIILLSVPIAAILEVAVLVIYEMVRYAPRIVCQGLEGALPVSCSFGELVGNSLLMAFLINGALAGVPMLISYIITGAAMALFFSVFSSSR